MRHALLRRLRREVLAPLLLRLAGRLDGRALALREDLGALVRAVERHLAHAGRPEEFTAASLGFALDEARRSIALYDASRANPRPRRRKVRGRVVVADGYAQGRADLQLVHGHGSDELLAAMYADPAHPLRRAVDADLRRRAEAIQRDARDRWNDLVARSWRDRP